jgi:hypothetical protein
VGGGGGEGKDATTHIHYMNNCVNSDGKRADLRHFLDTSVGEGLNWLLVRQFKTESNH